MIFTIKETQNENSDREGYKVEANTLKAAKITATKCQTFHGTVLKIEDENGALLATKNSKGWSA